MESGRLTAALVWFHRWVGVALCLMFAAWFLSGAVMVYVPFPTLDRAVAAGRAEPVAFAAVAVEPRAALAQSGVARPVSLRLASVRAVPTWLVQGEDGELVAIDARDERPAPAVTAADAGTIASRFARGVVASVEGPIRDDQWTVPNDYDALRPLYRVRLVDADDTDVYVSARSGEVVQWTTRRARAWNYIGAVVHWIYPTALRRHWSAWDRTVWWLSLIGTGLALAGAWLGVTRIAGRQRDGRWRWSAYRGWLRWHHVLGLTAGALVLTWVFSGWLSMDHRRLFSSPEPTPAQARAWAGASLATMLEGLAADRLGVLAPATRVEFRAAAGRAWVSADAGPGTRTYAVADGALAPVPGIPASVIANAVAQAWSARALRAERTAPHDVYAHLREGSLPDSTVRVELDDGPATWVHVDAATGAIVGVMDRSRRVYRWLFNGLHGFDVPPLSGHRALWDASLLLGLAAGLGFVITSVVIGWRRVRMR